MRRILLEEETHLRNLASEYKVRFDRERERLLEALRECGRCTKLISEILPGCISSQAAAGEILAGKPLNEINTMPKPQPQVVDHFPIHQPEQELAEQSPPPDGMLIGDLLAARLPQRAASGGDSQTHPELEESLL